MGGPGGGGAAGSGEVQLNMGNDFDIDDEVDKLHGKVSMLKHMTGAIHEEATVRGKLIDQLEETMNQARSALKDAKRRRGNFSGEKGGAQRGARRGPGDCRNRERERATRGHSVDVLFFFFSKLSSTTASHLP